MLGAFIPIFESDYSKLGRYVNGELVKEVICTYREKNAVAIVDVHLTSGQSFKFSEKQNQNLCSEFQALNGKVISAYHKFGYVVAVVDEYGRLINDYEGRKVSFHLTVLNLYFLPVLLMWRILYQVFSKWNQGYRGLKLFINPHD